MVSNLLCLNAILENQNIHAIAEVSLFTYIHTKLKYIISIVLYIASTSEGFNCWPKEAKMF